MRKQWLFIRLHISEPPGKAAPSPGFRKGIHFPSRPVHLDGAAPNLGNREVASLEKFKFLFAKDSCFLCHLPLPPP